MRSKPWHFFHTFDERGAVRHQGYVEQVLPNGDLRVITFSWLDGSATGTQVWRCDDPLVRGMQFFRNEVEWRDAGDRRGV